MRQLMATKQVRQPLGPVVRACKDTRAGCAVFGLANEDAQHQVREARKDFSPEQGAQKLYEVNDGRWYALHGLSSLSWCHPAGWTTPARGASFPRCLLHS